MNGIRTIARCTAVAVAVLFVANLARGAGEVTVVGAAWQAPAILPENVVERSVLQAPDAPMPDAKSPPAMPAQPAMPTQPAESSFMPDVEESGTEFSDEVADLDNWIGGWWLSGWTVDFRYRSLVSSGITSTFGTPAPPPTGYSPLTQLNFPISSSWYGVRIGLERPCWNAHLEWMAPQKSIDGDMSDYDWNFSTPPQTEQQYTDLGFARQRWTDAQMIDLGFDYKLRDCLFQLPIEVWPMIGFRWQRFNLTCYDGVQVKYDNQWLDPADLYPGDVISFNQQFYMGYLGAQFRMRVRSVLFTFQADWAYTWAYNINHPLALAGDYYTSEATQGNTWHIGITAEVPLTCHFSVGFQCDHSEIRTSGTHRYQNYPLGQDTSWDNGVDVSSNQTSLMAFLRLRF